MKKGKPKTNPHSFWNEEYKTKEHFALSYTVSEELEHFVRYVERNHSGFPNHLHILDVGCGNGRNLAWLARSYKATGAGFDFSETAIAEAREKASTLPISFRVQNIKDPFPEGDNSYDMVIDFMVSHVLVGADREAYLKEVLRVVKPGGWFILKTLLRDDDEHAHRLISESVEEKNGVYLHPRTGGLEYAGSEAELLEEVQKYFFVEKKQKSHAHRVRGKANKRRFIVFYLVKEK